ncbi:MAG: hypothetical protein COA79_16735 [Planctomycetota bacterium]|nr:MAG: hypothetical protein COA79_16735 [Planctomycetota bacterium]
MNWYEEAFDEYYLDIYDHRDDDDALKDVMFAKDILELNHKKTLLDLCCGAGRHSVLFSPLVKKVVGYDLSIPLLNVASQNALKQKCKNLFLLRGNMLHLDFNDCFDAVCSFFNSFGYFEKLEDHIKVLTNIYLSLNSGGCFLLDIMNVDYLKNNLIPISKKEIETYVITEKRSIDEHYSIVRKEVLIQLKSDLSEVKKYIESVHFFSKPQITEMLLTVGFEDIIFFGSTDGASVTPYSKRLLVVCKKPN